MRESQIPDFASKQLVRFICICQGNPNGIRLSRIVLFFLSLVLRATGLMLLKFKCMSSRLLTLLAWNMALLLWSINIPNHRPKMGLQRLVVVGSWDGNSGSRIKSAQETWCKDLVMVSLISIATVCDLNGFSDSTVMFFVRLRWAETTKCCDSLGSIGLSLSPYPQGYVVNSLMSYAYWFRVVLMVSKMNIPNQLESTPSRLFRSIG